MKNHEQLINEVNATMAIENMFLTDEDKENMRACLRRDISFSDMKKQIIQEYTIKSGSNEQSI